MEPDGVTPRRVLVIDDDPDLVDLLSDTLSLLGGYQVCVARDGASGLEQVHTLRPDCVVVDIRMPRLNGYQFVRALRGDPLTAQTPIVVVSALTQDRDRVLGLLTGADAYLFKPVEIHDLLGAVARAMGLTAQQRDQLQREMVNRNE